MNTLYSYITRQDPVSTTAVKDTDLTLKPEALHLRDAVSTHFYNPSLLISSPSLPPTQSKFSPVSLI